MADYLYLIHPFREGFFENPTQAETAAMDAHYQYLQTATRAGRVVLAGPCLDQTFGLVVFHAENEAEAGAFMLDDPSVQRNVMMAELHPFEISLKVDACG